MGKENYAIRHLILILLLNTVNYKLMYDNGYNNCIKQNLFLSYTASVINASKRLILYVLPVCQYAFCVLFNQAKKF